MRYPASQILLALFLLPPSPVTHAAFQDPFSAIPQNDVPQTALCG